MREELRTTLEDAAAFLLELAAAFFERVSPVDLEETTRLELTGAETTDCWELDDKPASSFDEGTFSQEEITSIAAAEEEPGAEELSRSSPGVQPEADSSITRAAARQNNRFTKHPSFP